MKSILILIFVLFSLNSIKAQSNTEENQIIGKWFLTEETNEKLIFKRKSKLQDIPYEKVLAEEMKDYSIEFFSNGKIESGHISYDSETFEEIIAGNDFKWNYNPESKYIISEVASHFKSKKLKLLEINPDKLVLLKILKD